MLSSTDSPDNVRGMQLFFQCSASISSKAAELSPVPRYLDFWRPSTELALQGIEVPCEDLLTALSRPTVRIQLALHAMNTSESVQDPPFNGARMY